MRPLGFLTGIILGSATSIALVLLMVVLVFAWSARQEPALGDEYPALLASAGLFAALAAAAGAAFVGLQQERSWRWAAQTLMWIVLAGIAWYYWPRNMTPGG